MRAMCRFRGGVRRWMGASEGEEGDHRPIVSVWVLMMPIGCLIYRRARAHVGGLSAFEWREMI